MGIVGVATLLIIVAPTSAQAANAPLGYQMMCLQSPDACRGGGDSRVIENGELLQTLQSVNTKVNRSIRPRHDAAGTDTWTLGAGQGDCEEYALSKRATLIRAGVSPSALRIAYVKTKTGEPHVVLVVKTSSGDLVLDNLTHAIKPLSRSGLTLISIAGANPQNWS
jgi:predicted transglutaminase-like cysteine proteinase